MHKKSQPEITGIVKRCAAAAAIVFLSIIFLEWQIGLWTNGSFIPPQALVRFYRFLGNTYPAFPAAVYTFSGTMVLMLYFGTQVLGEVLPNKKAAAVLGAVLACVAVAVPLNAMKMPKSAWGEWAGYLYFGTIFLIFIAECIPAVLSLWKSSRKKERIIKSAVRYLAVIVLAVISVVITGALLSALSHYRPAQVRYVSTLFSTINAASLITYCMVDQLFEETAFRGLIFGHLQKYVPAWAAAAFSSVLFGLWHRNLGQLVYTVPFGLLCCYIYRQTGRLRHAILCHSINNFVSFLAVARSGSVQPDNPIQKINAAILKLPLAGAILLLVVCTAAIVGILIGWNRLERRLDAAGTAAQPQADPKSVN